MRNMFADTNPRDQHGTAIRLNDRVYRAVNNCGTVFIKVQTVTEIKDGKFYLDNSKTAIQFPDRLIVTTRK